MQKEFNARAATTANSWQLMKNEAMALGIQIGTSMLPALKQVMEVAKKILTPIMEWTKKNPELAGKIMMVVAAAGVLGMVIGGILIAIGSVIGAVTTILGVISGATLAWIAVIVAALVAIGIAILYYWEDVKEYVGYAIKWWGEAWDAFVDWLIKAWDYMLDTTLAILKALPTAIMDIFDSLLNISVNWGLKFGEKIREIALRAYEAFKQGPDKMLEFLRSIDLTSAGRALFTTFIAGLKQTSGGAIDYVKNVVNRIRNLLPGSDAKEGPLSTLTAAGRAFPVTMAKGITQRANVLQNAMTNAISSPTLSIEPLVASSQEPTISSGITVTYAPTINLGAGGADTYAQASRALQAGHEDLLTQLERLQADRRRLSYA